MEVCTSGENVYGPFLKSQHRKCVAAGGGPACETMRWSMQFFESFRAEKRVGNGGISGNFDMPEPSDAEISEVLSLWATYYYIPTVQNLGSNGIRSKVQFGSSIRWARTLFSTTRGVGKATSRPTAQIIFLCRVYRTHGSIGRRDRLVMVLRGITLSLTGRLPSTHPTFPMELSFTSQRLVESPLSFPMGSRLCMMAISTPLTPVVHCMDAISTFSLEAPERIRFLSFAQIAAARSRLLLLVRATERRRWSHSIRRPDSNEMRCKTCLLQPSVF